MESAFVEALRADAVGSRHDELGRLVLSRKRKLQELYAVSRHIGRSKSFPNIDVVARWGTRDDLAGGSGVPLEDLERKFLEDNDLEKGFKFNEATLPTYSLPYNGPPPEPGGQAQPPPAPRHPTAVPAKPPPPPASKPALTSRAIQPAQPPRLRLRPSPSPVGQVAPIATLEVRTNGHASDAGTPVPIEDQQEPEVSDVTRATPSAVLSPTVDSAALMTEVGGVPVVSQAATEIPNAQGRATSLRPPILEEFDEREDERAIPPDVLSKEPVVKEPTPTPIQPLSSRDQEIPNSQESNLNATPPSSFEDPSLPDSPSQINQLSPHTPLAATTDRGNRARQVTPLKKLTHPDASSPASSDNVSTPENVISSATSPDSNQLPEPTGPNAVKDGGESMEKAFVSTAEHTAPKSVEKPDETLTSTEVAEEVVEMEQEFRAPLLTSNELSNASTRVEEEAKERELPASSVAEAPATAPQSPVSPDPSSVQLRLESQLANGEVPSVPPVPEDLPTLSETKVATTPSPSPRQSGTPGSVPSSPSRAAEDSTMDEDDEDEDHVQLVGSTEPVTRVPSPTAPTPETSPQAVPEAPVATEKQTLIVPSKPLTCEPEAPKGRDITSSDAVDEEAPKLLAIPQSKAAQSDIMKVDARAQSPPSSEMPDSLVMPVDVDKPEMMDQEDTAMQDAVLEPDGTTTVPAGKPEGQLLATKQVQNDRINKLRQQKQPTQEAPLPGDLSLSATPRVDLDEVEVDGIAVPAEVPEEKSRVTPATPDHSQPSRYVSEPAAGPSPAPLLSTIESGAWESTVPTQTQSTPPTQGEDASFTVPALFSPARRSSSRQRRPSQRAQLSTLSKVVISSAHHAAAAAEAEAQRLREDQEQQGLIVVARRRNQQAAAVAGRGRPSVFPPGSKLDLLTKYTIQDDATKEHKTPDPFDVLYTAKSVPTSVGELLLKASKTITTDNHNLVQDDMLAVKVLTRIQDLQDQDMWSLQQVAKVAEPKRRVTHWDYLLKEMKWLTTDFKEERKWKISQAKCLVDMVMEWHGLPSGRRPEVTVDRKTWGRVPKAFREQQKKTRVNGECNEDHPTPELVASGGTPEDEGSDDYFVKQEGHDEMDIDLDHAAIYDHIGDPPPAAVFSLRPDETIFSMPPTKASEETLAQLPLFAPPKPPSPGSRTEYIGGDSSKTTLIPVSKYAIGRMVFTGGDEPPRKRTRFEYDYNCELYADDSDEEGEVVSGGFNGTGYDSYGRPKSRDKASRPLPLHPEQNNVALFRPEFKPTLQRIRSHIFRPPLEQPPQAFFECRAPSLWTSEEDEKLRLLAKEYNHNWALVSLYMEIEGEYHSSAERRSPWECFERWMGIENVPQEFTKSPFYKPVQQRLELAARASVQHIAAANSSNGQQVSQLKRRGTVPAKVDRRRNTRPFSQFEAMRKLAKKRETSMSKQAQSNRAAQVAALRKQATPNPNNQMRTPQYFSSMKYEKDVKAMEQKQLMAQMSRLPQGAPHPGRLSNGVPVQGQPGRVGTPSQATPGANPGDPLPNGLNSHAGRSPQLQQLQQAGMNPYPPGLRHSAAAMQHHQINSQQAAQLRYQALRQQQFQQQAAGGAASPQVQAMLASAQQAALGAAKSASPIPQQQHTQVPTQAEIAATLQRQHPHITPEQAAAAAAKRYHSQLSSNIAGRNPGALRAGMTGNQSRSATAGTGVLIGANGPIGPGAAQAVAQQQTQQGGSRGGTPQGQGSPGIGMAMQMGQSPRMSGQQSPGGGGGAGIGGMQSPRIQVQSPRVPQVGVGLGIHQSPPPQQQQQQMGQMQQQPQ